MVTECAGLIPVQLTHGRTLLIPKGSTLKMMPYYMFFIAIVLDTSKMTALMIHHAKHRLEAQLCPSFGQFTFFFI